MSDERRNDERRNGERCNGDQTAEEARQAARRARLQGLLRAGVGGAAALVLYLWLSPLAAWIVLGITTLLLLAALLSPLGVYRAIDDALMAFARGVGVAMTWLLMPLLFFLVFWPLGWLLRTTGRLRFEGAGFDRDAATYWRDHPQAAAAPDGDDPLAPYRRQF